MKELLRSNDLVLISAIEAILAEENIRCFVLDSHTSVAEGSLGMLPRRLMVADVDVVEARAALTNAGLAGELRDG